MTRCVDPTHAMKTTFSPLAVGKLRFGKTGKVGQSVHLRQPMRQHGAGDYDYFTVHSDGSYTEVNELNVGKLPRRELVDAHRIGDCLKRGDVGRPPLLSH
jgi:hypothetical protein